MASNAPHDLECDFVAQLCQRWRRHTIVTCKRRPDLRDACLRAHDVFLRSHQSLVRQQVEIALPAARDDGTLLSDHLGKGLEQRLMRFAEGTRSLRKYRAVDRKAFVDALVREVKIAVILVPIPLPNRRVLEILATLKPFSDDHDAEDRFLKACIGPWKTTRASGTVRIFFLQPVPVALIPTQ